MIGIKGIGRRRICEWEGLVLKGTGLFVEMVNS